jgi:hypothetical protein
MIKATFTLTDHSGFQSEDTMYGDCPVVLAEDIQTLCDNEGCEASDIQLTEE